MFPNPSGDTTRARRSHTSIRDAARRGLRRRPHTRVTKPAGEHQGETIRLEIVSMMAALSGTHGAITWSGEIPREELCRLIPDGRRPTRESLNAAIVRYFNRVEAPDNDRLERLGYTLPSLGAGDIFAVHGIAFVVAAVGCERISGDEDRLRRFVKSWLHQA
jgi:hypothetical protein